MSFNIQLRRVWTIPILLGALTLFGVLAAFMGSGAWLWAFAAGSLRAMHDLLVASHDHRTVLIAMLEYAPLRSNIAAFRH